MAVSWRFVPPNVVTCIGLTAGLLSVSEAVGGRFESAAWWVIICMLLDKADGTVARLLKASSRFGMELDSLADLICFCVAPAVLVLCVLAGPGRNPGLEQTALYLTGVYAGCFLFVIMGALRLAKFNVVSESYGRRFFLASPPHRRARSSPPTTSLLSNTNSPGNSCRRYPSSWWCWPY